MDGARASNVAAAYPEGSKVAIKNPCLKEGFDGSVALHINDPASMQMVGPDSPLRKVVPTKKAGSDTGSPGTVEGGDKAPSDGSSSSTSLNVANGALNGNGDSEVDPVDLLLIEGNSWLEKGEPSKAMQCYSSGIRWIEGNGSIAPQEHLGKNQKKHLKKKNKKKLFSGSADQGNDILQDPGKCHQLVLAYCGRAQACHILNNFEQVWSDSLKALRLDEGHLISTIQKGQALLGLHRYDEAISCFEALKDVTGFGEVKKLLARALEEKPVRNLPMVAVTDSSVVAAAGSYGVAATASTSAPFPTETQHRLEAYFASGCRGSPPDCCNFVGPVEIRRVPEVMGRGLFLTRDVREGEVLLVSNALAVARVVPTARPSLSIMAMMGMEPVLEELAEQLLVKANSNPNVADQLETLQGNKKVDLPPMSLFSGGSTSRSPRQGVRQPRGNRTRHLVRTASRVDLGDILPVIPFNAISTFGGGSILATFGYKLNHKKMGSKPEKFFSEDRADVAGLWGLPSFINHSCCPNASWRHVGEAMFINASRDMRAGEEITIAVHDVLQTESSRASNFVCLCPRCLFERKVHGRVASFKVLTSRLCEYVNKVYANRGSATLSVEKLAEYMEKLAALSFEVEKMLKEDVNCANMEEMKKNWIRVSFTEAYLPRVVHPITGVPFPVALPAEEFFQIVRTVYPGCDKLLSLFGGKHNFFPDTSKEEVSRMSLQLCRCIYGPMRDSSLQAILEWRHKLQSYGAQFSLTEI